MLFFKILGIKSRLEIVCYSSPIFLLCTLRSSDTHAQALRIMLMKAYMRITWTTQGPEAAVHLLM